MRIEEKVSNLILQFQKTSDKETLKQIIKGVSDMIYNYPLLVFHKGMDDCSDFYIYLIERLEKLIKKYNPALSAFNTWFNIVLKSQCINWLNSKANKKKNNNPALSLNNDSIFIELAVTESHNKNEENYIKLTVSEYIDSLKGFDFLLIKLLYFTIDKKLLKQLSNYNKRSYEENIKLINKFLNNNKKFNIQFQLTKQISILQYKIFKLKEKFNSNKKEENLKIKIDKHTNELLSLKKTLSRHLENFDILSIASLLNSNKNEIYYRLNKIKQDLYIMLKDKFINLKN